MSSVTDYIITLRDTIDAISPWQPDPALVLAEMQAALVRFQGYPFACFDCTAARGETNMGPKGFCSPCWIATGNGLGPESFAEAMASAELPRVESGSVVLPGPWLLRYLVVFARHEEDENGFARCWPLPVLAVMRGPRHCRKAGPCVLPNGHGGDCVP